MCEVLGSTYIMSNNTDKYSLDSSEASGLSDNISFTTDSGYSRRNRKVLLMDLLFYSQSLRYLYPLVGQGLNLILLMENQMMKRNVNSIHLHEGHMFLNFNHQ